MPSSYIKSVPSVDIQNLFDRLVQQLPSKREHSALAEIYTSEFGDPALDYSLPQIRDELLIRPIQLFDLVSFLLRNPPSFLNDVETRERLAQALTIDISDFERIRVTEFGVWVRELDLDLQTSIQINRYEYYPGFTTDEITEITSTPIYNYLKSAVVCFRSDLLPSALALSAIAFEACLREVLTGIDRHSLPQPPLFKRSSARVDAHLDNITGEPVLFFNVQGTVQSIRDFFRAHEPKGPKQFLGSVRLKICREDRSNDLRLMVDSRYIDLLSSDELEARPTHRPAKNFSEFIQVAELAGRLKARRLPWNSAEVIRKVRNILVHWSKDALAEPLNPAITIGDYINGPDTVRATIADVASFISDEYYDLRQFERTGNL